MIWVKNGTTERIASWNKNNTYILTDFDRTLTLGGSITSWSVLAKSNEVPKEYVEERQKYYDEYRPIEINETLDYDFKNEKMKEWWKKHIALFVKYKLKEEVILKACRDYRIMSFRDGAKDFLKKCFENNVPIIIISAGIGNFIEEFLKQHNCNYPNIYIVSNFIKFENGVAVGIYHNNIIHSLNKNEVSMPQEVKKVIENRKNEIVLGDQVGDIKMSEFSKREKALKIGFLEENVEQNEDIYKKSFDIVLTNNGSFEELKKIIDL